MTAPVVIVQTLVEDVVVPGAIPGTVVVVQGVAPAVTVVDVVATPVNVVGAEPLDVVVVSDGTPGPPGPPGPAGSGAIHWNLTGVSSQTFTHDFDHPPMVWLEYVGALALISATYVDSTHFFLEFPSPFTGTVVAA